MKVLPFTIPVAHDKSVIAQAEDLPYFYPHLHRHKEAQLTWIQKGEGTLIVGNNMHAFEGGEIYWLGADQPHLFKSNPEYFQHGSEKGVKNLMIFFDPKGQLSAIFDLPEMKPFKEFIQQHRQGFKLPAELLEKVSGLMLEIQAASGPEQLMHFLQLLKTLNAMAVKPDPLSVFGNSPGITDSEGLRISNIYTYIIQHYNESITLDDVAKAAFMTPQAFCRYFKKHTGHTFISFLNEMRINEACKKLTSNKYESVSGIAYNCGFSSITNFNRVFKSIIGKSPREYVDSYMSSLAYH